MSRFMRRYPSPSLVVSITALVVALGGAGYSATGGNFILGQANSATTQTKLVTPLAGAAFRVDNTSTAAAATGMTIVTNAARPPLAVNSSTKVANLNADKLDGLDSTHFPRTAVVSYNLAGGANSAPIALPPSRPVLVMGVNTTSGEEGVGQVTLVRRPGEYIKWIGLETPGLAAITSGGTGTAGAHIVYIDLDLFVDIQVNDPDTIRVHNGSTGTRTGNVTLIW